MYEIGNLKVLIAEDNPINVKVAKFTFSSIASQIDIVNNGEEVIEKFNSGHYDMIFMDVKMPRMDGFEATRKIREIEANRADGSHIPIIALTANNLYEQIQECLDNGMDAFLAKPIKTEDIVAVINSLEQ
jgi:two-component system, sensor histidine kinase and response regulator